MALNIVITFSTGLASLINNWTLMETSIGAVARVQAFVRDTEHEYPASAPTIPPPDWPSAAAVEFCDVRASTGRLQSRRRTLNRKPADNIPQERWPPGSERRLSEDPSRHKSSPSAAAPAAASPRSFCVSCGSWTPSKAPSPSTGATLRLWTRRVSAPASAPSRKQPTSCQDPSAAISIRTTPPPTPRLSASCKQCRSGSGRAGRPRR